MIHVAIVEDEAVHADKLRAFIEQYGKEKNIAFAVDVYGNGMDFASDYKPYIDAIFIDIEMPFLNGIDCAEKIRQMDESVPIIFVTASVQYAVRGYEVAALGYMVKPITYFSFKLIMDKVIAKIRRDDKDICIQGRDFTKRISIRDLYYIEVMDHYLIYHTTAGEYRAIGKMNEVADQLAGYNFFRCSNSHLVNLLYVREVTENQITVGEDKVFISRRKKKDFLIALNNFFKNGGI